MQGKSTINKFRIHERESEAFEYSDITNRNHPYVHHLGKAIISGKKGK